ncbi:hypothetical protein [Neptuniibacter sp. QD37_11]|uniref:hypothetical protein n=1 Tax=Neptuniibacter sp. QD37_11 TaxID=3398209 RepID=UPI0039F5F9A8
MEEVGFWHGLWHGLIILFALIGSFFDSSMTLFAAYNNGAWYNLGFVLGALGSGYAFFWGCVAGVGIFMAALYAALDYAERFFK